MAWAEEERSGFELSALSLKGVVWCGCLLVSSGWAPSLSEGVILAERTAELTSGKGGGGEIMLVACEHYLAGGSVGVANPPAKMRASPPNSFPLLKGARGLAGRGLRTTPLNPILHNFI